MLVESAPPVRAAAEALSAARERLEKLQAAQVRLNAQALALSAEYGGLDNKFQVDLIDGSGLDTDLLSRRLQVKDQLSAVRSALQACVEELQPAASREIQELSARHDAILSAALLGLANERATSLASQLAAGAENEIGLEVNFAGSLSGLLVGEAKRLRTRAAHTRGTIRK